MSSDDDPMAYLAKMKAKMAGLAEMQEVAAQQMAIANNVRARMAKIDALLEGGPSTPSGHASGDNNYVNNNADNYGRNGSGNHHSSNNSGAASSNENANPDTQGMTAKEEEEYWKRKIAMLSQPVTAQGLGGGGGGGGGGRGGGGGGG